MQNLISLSCKLAISFMYVKVLWLKKSYLLRFFAKRKTNERNKFELLLKLTIFWIHHKTVITMPHATEKSIGRPGFDWSFLQHFKHCLTIILFEILASSWVSMRQLFIQVQITVSIPVSSESYCGNGKKNLFLRKTSKTFLSILSYLLDHCQHSR